MMFWKILLLVIAGLILILGIIKAWLDARSQKPGRNARRDIFIALVLACLVGIYPLIQLLQPNEIKENLKPIVESQKRIEQKLDSLGRQPGEPVPYKDGIPQSKNFNLRALFEEGQKHLENYEYDKAIKAFRAALALQELKPSESAALLIHIGIVQHKQSKWDEAEGTWKEALDWAEKGNDESGQAAALGNLGLVYQAKGEWDKAIEFYNKDLEISKKIGDEHGMAATFNNLGLVYQDKGEWDKAIEFYNKSLKIKEKIGDEYGMASTFNNLGVVYQAKGEWDKAIEFYNKSLKIKEKIGDEYGMAQTKGNIAILYKIQGKKKEAKKIFEEILNYFEKIGDKPNADRTRKNLEDL
jgi:tetratricopeptide (TPR) repeat protein